MKNSVILAISSLADALSTVAALRQGFSEANPVMAWLLEQTTITEWVVLKVALTLVLFWILSAPFNTKSTTAIALGASAVFIAACIHNLIHIL